MIKLSSYHTHTEFCDGRSTMDETVREAIKRGCSEIGFSTHSPLPYKNSWCLKKENEEKYLSTLEKLKKQHEKQIKVYKGIEYDLLSGVDTTKYDYIIGSVHHVVSDGNFYSVDHGADITRSIVNDAFGGDPYLYCESYFSNVECIYKHTKCDIIGHFDLVTKFLEIDPLFDTSHPRYIRAINRAFDELAFTPAVFEVNTGAIHRRYRTTPYPSDYILDRIKDLGKPVVITSDSHSADTVDFMLDEWGERLCARGMKVIASMDELLSITRK